MISEKLHSTTQSSNSMSVKSTLGYIRANDLTYLWWDLISDTLSVVSSYAPDNTFFQQRPTQKRSFLSSLILYRECFPFESLHSRHDELHQIQSFFAPPPHPQLPNPSWFPSNEWKRQTHQAILESQLFPQRENHITHWATFPIKPSLSGPHLQTPIILIILKHSETRKEPCSREHYSNWHCHSDVPGGLLAVSCPKSVLCYTHSSHTPLSVLDI